MMNKISFLPERKWRHKKVQVSQFYLIPLLFLGFIENLKNVVSGLLWSRDDKEDMIEAKAWELFERKL